MAFISGFKFAINKRGKYRVDRRAEIWFLRGGICAQECSNRQERVHVFYTETVTRQRLRAGKIGVFNKEISEEADSKSTPNRDSWKQ